MVYLTSFAFFSGDIKNKKKLWKWPVNWSFSELFYLFIFDRPPPPPIHPKSDFFPPVK